MSKSTISSFQLFAMFPVADYTDVVKYKSETA